MCLLGAFHLCDSLRLVSHRHEIPGVVTTSLGQAGIQFQGTAELLLRTRPVPFQVEPDLCQSRMGLGERIVQFQCSES